MKKKWFRAKRYGWGWYPATWQGWLIVLLFIVLMVLNFKRIDASSHSASDTIRPYVIQTFLLSGVLVLIAALTGEKPGWRWGDKPIVLKKTKPRNK